MCELQYLICIFDCACAYLLCTLKGELYICLCLMSKTLLTNKWGLSYNNNNNNSSSNRN